MKVEESELLLTVDVMELYTNIPHKEGIERVTTFIRKNGATEQEIELCEHILQKNYLSSTIKYTYKSQVLLWAPDVHPTMPSYSWLKLKKNSSKPKERSPEYGSDS